MAGIDPRYYWLTLVLLGCCTVVGVVIVFRLQRDVQEDDAPPTEKDLLGPLEKAYYSGLMTEEEFRRINSSMARQKEGPLPLTKPVKASMTLAEAAEPAPGVPVDPGPGDPA